MEERIAIPENVEVQIDGNLLKFKGPKGENARRFSHPSVEINKKDNSLILSSKKDSKKEKSIIKTFKAHLRNLIKGAAEGFVYKVRACSSHFPMSLSVEGDKVLIKNFFGEKVPRKAKIMEGVSVNIEGNDMIIEGTDIEKVGQTAANIEKSTKIRRRDRRVFQDGCYLYQKGEEIIE